MAAFSTAKWPHFRDPLTAARGTLQQGFRVVRLALWRPPCSAFGTWSQSLTCGNARIQVPLALRRAQESDIGTTARAKSAIGTTARSPCSAFGTLARAATTKMRSVKLVRALFRCLLANPTMDRLVLGLMDAGWWGRARQLTLRVGAWPTPAAARWVGSGVDGHWMVGQGAPTHPSGWSLANPSAGE